MVLRRHVEVSGDGGERDYQLCLCVCVYVCMKSMYVCIKAEEGMLRCLGTEGRETATCVYVCVYVCMYL